jgi:hypothetical protein
MLTASRRGRKGGSLLTPPPPRSRCPPHTLPCPVDRRGSGGAIPAKSAPKVCCALTSVPVVRPRREFPVRYGMGRYVESLRLLGK